MEGKRFVALAERLARGGQAEALRFLVRMAALPLLAEGMTRWTEGDSTPTSRLLEDAIPEGVSRALRQAGVEPARTDRQEAAVPPVDLGRDTVISFPWNEDRLARLLEWLAAEEWRFDPRNHQVYRYTPLGVAVFFNGLHSGAVGILKGEGQVPAHQVDLSPLYEAGFRVEWRAARRGLLGGVGEEVPHAVFGGVAEPMPEGPALLLALGEVLHRHGIRL